MGPGRERARDGGGATSAGSRRLQRGEGVAAARSSSGSVSTRLFSGWLLSAELPAQGFVTKPPPAAAVAVLGSLANDRREIMRM